LTRVPREVLISNLRVIREVFPQFQDWEDQHGFGLPLIAYLVREKHRADSEIGPYLDVLPKDFSNHPIMWDEKTLNLTAGTGIDLRTQNTKRRLQSHYQSLSTQLQMAYEFPSFTWDDFLWAYLVVQTRSWNLAVEDGARDIILAPYADMLNHKPNAGHGNLNDLTTFEIPATEDYQVGQEVFDSYGRKCNLDLLSGYGFVLEDNNEDYMDVSTVLPEAKGSNQTRVHTIRLKKNTVPMEFLRHIRRSLLTVEEQQEEEEKLESDSAISFPLERRTIYTAISVVRSAAERASATVGRAQKELERSDLNENERNIWLLRKTQLQLLRNVKRVLAQHWERQLFDRRLYGGLEF